MKVTTLYPWIRKLRLSVRNSPQSRIKSHGIVVDGATWLSDHVERIIAVEAAGCNGEILQLSEVELAVHIYKLYGSTESYLLHAPGAPGDTLGDDRPNSQVVNLPSKLLDGLWESLIYGSDIKNKLLRFIFSLLYFAERKVSFTFISFNRLVLLHGPPGSGKTSLCRALAQKLSIRLSKKFSRCKLIEINSHSLFSKYFSESGKLVSKMFDEIFHMLADRELFAVVLIDEVETLTASRKAAAAGNEPTDGLRVGGF